MNDYVSKLCDKIFDKIPYSLKSEKARTDISAALEKEYEKESEKLNEIQSAGEIFRKFGTISDAADLAGYNQEQIEELTDESLASDEKDFKKLFSKIRHRIYLTTFMIMFALLPLLSIMISGEWLYACYTLAFGALSALSLLRLRKLSNKSNFENIKLKSKARVYLDKMSDKYSKRLINSIFISMAGIAFEIFTIMISIFKVKLKVGEALQLSNSTIAGDVIIFILVKNFLCRHFIDKYYTSESRERFEKHKHAIIILSMAYWIVSLAVLIILRDTVQFVFNFFYLFLAVYCLLFIGYNLFIRKLVVLNNITLNIRRAVSVGLCVCAFTFYQVMQMDSWLLEPYISKVSAVEHSDNNIDYDEDSGVYTITAKNSDFKILQLTDIHLGGSPISVYKDYKALNACYDLINNTKPDLVVVTGDLVFPMGIMSFSLNNSAPIVQFATFMRNIGIPWAFTYGNHDTEIMAKNSVTEIQEMYKSLSYKTSANLLYPYVEPDIKGRNNQEIEIRNADGSLNQALFLLDSNDYTGNGVNDYDYIHDDEVDWYAKQVKKLDAQEGKNVSSLLFFHMPLQQYRTAYQLYESGSNDVKYFFGENGEKMINKVCCSNYPSKLFDTAKKLGSTTAMFCGHDHYNNMSLEYQGIRLTYGMSIDYLAMPGIDKDTKQRGGTLITLHKDSSYDIKQIRLTDIQNKSSVGLLK